MESKSFRKQFFSGLRWVGWALLVQVLLINICAALYAYKLTHFYDEVKQESFDEGNIFTQSWKIFSGPKYARSPVEGKPSFVTEEISLTLKNGSAIRGWYGLASDSSKGTVLFFHGIGGNRSSMEDEAAAFIRKNYNVLLIDFRAHGNSEGRTCTIGYREGEEVKACFEYIRSRGEKNIFFYGSSMGAVSVARAMYEYSLNPSGIILDMPFESLQDYLEAKARILGFPKQPFAFLTTFWIGVERGFNGFKHNTARYAAAIHCPVILQWGTLDNFVLREETDKIYNALGSSDKKLVIYNGAYHESFLRKDPLKWRIEIDRFLSVNSH